MSKDPLIEDTEARELGIGGLGQSSWHMNIKDQDELGPESEQRRWSIGQGDCIIQNKEEINPGIKVDGRGLNFSWGVRT